MSSRCRVVVADDNHDAADTLVEILGAMGYAAVAAYDGREAVEACSAWHPDLAILDVEMPLLDGCAAARLIRSGARPPAMIAALSGLRHWQEPLKANVGVFDVRLAKPPRMDQLAELLAKALGRGRAAGSK
jgi:CheY-like chemotaxis protein